MPRSTTIDLNADLGEGGRHDGELMQLVSSANIACCGHAGDEASMRSAVEAAVAAGVAVGAHPGYEDPENFGRKALDLTPEETHTMVCRQLEHLLAIHPELHHVKPHGALYHQANTDPLIAAAVIKAMKSLTPSAILYAPPAGELANSASQHGITHCAEGFIDRRYTPDGLLTPRTETDAVIHDAKAAAAQALEIATHQSVTTSDGSRIPLAVRTLCVHGDSPDALATLQYTRNALLDAGHAIQWQKP